MRYIVLSEEADGSLTMIGVSSLDAVTAIRKEQGSAVRVFEEMTFPEVPREQLKFPFAEETAP